MKTLGILFLVSITLSAIMPATAGNYPEMDRVTGTLFGKGAMPGMFKRYNVPESDKGWFVPSYCKEMKVVFLQDEGQAAIGAMDRMKIISSVTNYSRTSGIKITPGDANIFYGSQTLIMFVGSVDAIDDVHTWSRNSSGGHESFGRWRRSFSSSGHQSSSSDIRSIELYGSYAGVICWGDGSSFCDVGEASNQMQIQIGSRESSSSSNSDSQSHRGRSSSSSSYESSESGTQRSGNIARARGMSQIHKGNRMDLGESAAYCMKRAFQQMKVDEIKAKRSKSAPEPTNDRSTGNAGTPDD